MIKKNTCIVRKNIEPFLFHYFIAALMSCMGAYKILPPLVVRLSVLRLLASLPPLSLPWQPFSKVNAGLPGNPSLHPEDPI